MKRLVRLKFRFDLGASFLTVVNFVFLVIAAGDKLKTFVPLETKWLLVILVPSALTGVVLLGWVLDKLRVTQSYNDEANSRNENWERLFKLLEKR